MLKKLCVLALFGLFGSVAKAEQIETLHIAMPGSHPSAPETYLCTPKKLDTSRKGYVIGFKPNATSATAHHMLLYGCSTPGQYDPVFNCGAMTAKQANLKSALSPCGTFAKSQIIYAWAQNAPSLELPEDVAFQVGGDTGIDYLVLQVHYASVAKIPRTGDVSGVGLEISRRPRSKRAAVYMMATRGRFPGKSTTHAEVACEIKPHVDVHPFAFRVHTHSLGTVVSGWRVRNKGEWSLIGKEDPQLPQMFYPVDDDHMTIKKGETIAARCTMVNEQDSAVWVGSTRKDEMCNFYMMYWTQGDDEVDMGTCSSFGPPLYSWGGWILGGGLSNIPDVEASEL